MDSNRHIKLDSGLFLSDVMHKNLKCTYSLIGYCVIMIVGALIKLLSFPHIESKGFNRSILICDVVVSALILVSVLLIFISGQKQSKKLAKPVMLCQTVVIAADYWVTYAYLYKCFSSNLMNAHFTETFFYFSCALYTILNLLSASFVMSFLKSSVVRKHASPALKTVSYIGIAVCVLEFLSYIISVFYSTKAYEDFLTGNFGDILRFGIAPLLFCSFWFILRAAGKKIDVVFKEVEEAFSSFVPLEEESEDDSDIKIASIGKNECAVEEIDHADDEELPELSLDVSDIQKEITAKYNSGEVEVLEIEDEPFEEEIPVDNTDENVPEQTENEIITVSENDVKEIEDVADDSENKEVTDSEESVDLMSDFVSDVHKSVAVWEDELDGFEDEEDDDEEFRISIDSKAADVVMAENEDDGQEIEETSDEPEEEEVPVAAFESEIEQETDSEPVPKSDEKSSDKKPNVSAFFTAVGAGIALGGKKVLSAIGPAAKICRGKLKIAGANISAKLYTLVLLVNYEGKIPKSKKEACEKERLEKIEKAQQIINSAKCGNVASEEDPTQEQETEPETVIESDNTETEDEWLTADDSAFVPETESDEEPEEETAEEETDADTDEETVQEDETEESENEIPASVPVDKSEHSAGTTHGRKYRKKR